MKTLDEVIKALEMCTTCPEDDEMCPGCPYANADGIPECVGQDKEDALHYLKEYRMMMDDIVAKREALDTKRNYYQQLIQNFERNEPLTWDELKTMEGKPVWVEGSAFADGFWTIPYFFGDSGGYEYFFGHGDQYWKEQMRDADDGLSWQAYRKERE